MLEWSLWLVSFHNNNIISSLSRSSNEKYIKFMASLFRVPIVTYQSNRHICMLRTTTVNSTFVPYKYHKKPCISCRNLLLKGFWGWGCRLHTMKGSEKLSKMLDVMVQIFEKILTWKFNIITITFKITISWWLLKESIKNPII